MRIGIESRVCTYLSFKSWVKICTKKSCKALMRGVISAGPSFLKAQKLRISFRNEGTAQNACRITFRKQFNDPVLFSIPNSYPISDCFVIRLIWVPVLFLTWFELVVKFDYICVGGPTRWEFALTFTVVVPLLFFIHVFSWLIEPIKLSNFRPQCLQGYCAFVFTGFCTHSVSCSITWDYASWRTFSLLWKLQYLHLRAA